MKHTVTVTLAALALVLASAADARSPMDEPGAINLNLFAAYGSLTGNSRFGLDFNAGAGFGVNLRYTAAEHWALGLIFNSQRYQKRDDAANVDLIDKLVMTMVLGEVYYYPNRESSASWYFVGGIGFYRPEIREQGEVVVFPGENLALQAGLGSELFIGETWGVDVSGRGFAYYGDGIADAEVDPPDGRDPVTADGKWSLGLHAQVGIFFYLLK
jgi:opacity protein-like surface antigen